MLTRIMVSLVRDYRSDWSLLVNEPVAGNYYPVIFSALVRMKNGLNCLRFLLTPV